MLVAQKPEHGGAHGGDFGRDARAHADRVVVHGQNEQDDPCHGHQSDPRHLVADQGRAEPHQRKHRVGPNAKVLDVDHGGTPVRFPLLRSRRFLRRRRILRRLDRLLRQSRRFVLGVAGLGGWRARDVHVHRALEPNQRADPQRIGQLDEQVEAQPHRRSVIGSREACQFTA
jgi:hypothetical protein